MKKGSLKTNSITIGCGIIGTGMILGKVSLDWMELQMSRHYLKVFDESTHVLRQGNPQYVKRKVEEFKSLIPQWTRAQAEIVLNKFVVRDLSLYRNFKKLPMDVRKRIVLFLENGYMPDKVYDCGFCLEDREAYVDEISRIIGDLSDKTYDMWDKEIKGVTYDDIRMEVSKVSDVYRRYMIGARDCILPPMYKDIIYRLAKMCGCKSVNTVHVYDVTFNNWIEDFED